MRWVKKGLVYGPDHRMKWASHSALTPTPVVLGDLIRVFGGFRDDAGVSRIGYVDVAADNPSRVIRVSRDPVLDIGAGGMFDDNGVILGDIVRAGGEWRMYYVGFQLVARAKFLAFSGLATSQDGCTTFSRFSETPIMDRSDEGLYIRAIHTAMFDEGRWKLWYAAGRRWESINGKPYPCYEIRYLESGDGLTIGREGSVCISPSGGEYRIGRPRVYKEEGVYKMLFTKGGRDGSYLPGYAESKDGVRWTRSDDRGGLSPSASGWDSKALCYPTPVTVGDTRYLFYNGGDMGRDGFGYAELEHG